MGPTLLLILAVLPYVALDDVPTVSLLPRLDITLPAVTDGTCRRHTRLVYEGLRNQTLWAMRMWDASAQGATGALYGNAWQFGIFDECTLHTEAPFQTQYCLLVVKNNITTYSEHDVGHYVQGTINDRRYLSRNMEHPAICIPASCTAEELQQALTEDVNSKYNDSGVTYTVTVVPDLCTKINESEPWTANEICFTIAIVLIITATLCGSILPALNIKSPLLSCFSLPENAEKLFSVRSGDEESKHFSVFHAVKVISMSIVIVGHRGSLPLAVGVTNYKNAEDMGQGPARYGWGHADLTVDNFFIMSAVLATHALCKVLAKRKINLIQVAIARIIRLAPAYYMLVWFQSSIAHRVSSGPIWNRTLKTETEVCQNYWWANLLFINNYFDASKVCLLHSWYLGCDMHFFLLTLLLVPLLVKKPALSKWLLGGLIVVSSLMPAITVFFNDGLDPLLLYFDEFLGNPRNSQQLSQLYNPSHNRVTVYLVGMATGYYLYLNDQSKYIMPKKWIPVAIAVCLGIIWTPMGMGGHFYTAANTHDISLGYKVFYAAVRRLLFAIGFCGLFIIHRYAGKDIFEWLSSSQLVIVFSRLTYTIYLIHFPFIIFTWASHRTAVTWTRFNMVYNGMGDMTLTLALSICIFLIIELPVKRIFQEVIFARKKEEPPPSAPQQIVTVTKF